MRALTKFFLYSNLLIALCAVAMTGETLFFFTQFPQPQTRSLLVFVGVAALAAYGIHWILSIAHHAPTPRIEWTRKHLRLMHVVSALGLVGAGLAFWPLRNAWTPVLPAAGMTLIYILPKVDRFRQLRALAFGKTFMLATTWTYITAIMPMLMLEAPLDSPWLWFTIGRFFLVYAICLLFDHRDVEQDTREGLSTLPARINEQQLSILFHACLFICIMAMVLSLRMDPSPQILSHPLRAGWILLSRIAAPLILAGLYRKAIRTEDDFFYYGILDFLMMLSALLSFGMAF